MTSHPHRLGDVVLFKFACLIYSGSDQCRWGSKRDAITQKALTAETSPRSLPTTSEGAGMLGQRVIRKNHATLPGLPSPSIPIFVVPTKYPCTMAGVTIDDPPTRSLICSPLPM